MSTKLVNSYTELEMRAKLMEYEIPHHLHDGLIAYLFDGIGMGKFLTCVVENDLSGAVIRADTLSIIALKPLVCFCNMMMPSNAWGSPDKVNAWIAAHRPVTTTEAT